MTTNVTVGIYPNMTDEVYFNLPIIHSSTLKYHKQSAAHAKHYMTEGIFYNSGMRSGTALHWAVLEPELFDEGVVKGPDARQDSDVWRDFCAEHVGKLVLSARDYNTVGRQRDAIMMDPILRSILERPGQAETVYTCEHPTTGLIYGIKVDWLFEIDGYTVAMDLKGCKLATPEAFAASIAEHDYYFQAAMYSMGLAYHGIDAHWCWLAAPRTKPIVPALYWPVEVSMERAAFEVNAAFTQHLECLSSGKWPGPDVRTLLSDGSTEDDVHFRNHSASDLTVHERLTYQSKG